MLKERTQGTPLRLYHYGLPAMSNFQFHLIGRIDDVCMAFLENIQACDSYPFLFKAKLPWSKNVLEERDAPWQFMLASCDAFFDVHSSLALWLEVYYHEYPPGVDTPYVFQFGDDISIPAGGEKNKAKAQKIFKEYYETEEFQQVSSRNGPCGSHSMRKYGSTTVRQNGGSKDEKDQRGRWKRDKRVSDDYDDIELPFIDAKVAAMLCPGGACRYAIRPNSSVTDSFILEFVTPKIAEYLDKDIALVLGRALLWYVYSTEEGVFSVPDFLRERIRNRLTLPTGMTNPIKKIPIVVTGSDAEVRFNDVEDFEQETTVPPPAATTAATTAAATQNTTAPVPLPTTPTGGYVNGISNLSMRDQVTVLINQQRQLYNQNLQIMRMIKEQEKQRHADSRRINANLQRVALQPARRIGIGNPNPTIQQQLQQQQQQQQQQPTNNHHQQQQQMAVRGPTANLSKVRNLYELWHEYEFGNDGNKAAKYFTSAERGTVKHKYTRRKVFWDCIMRQTNRGVSYNVAIDRVYQVYGHEKSVTKIINEMRTDKKNNNLHTSLR